MSNWLVWALLSLTLWCVSAAADGVDTEGALHHIVLVRFSESATVIQRDQVIQDSLTLLKSIPGVEQVAAGAKAPASRPEHIQQYDVGIYVQLQNASFLEAYAAHPNHQQVLRNNRAAIESIRVIDFFGQP